MLNFVSFDIETTGFSPTKNSIIEIGAIRSDGQEFSSLVYTPKIPKFIRELTGIESTIGAPMICDVLAEFRDFIKPSDMIIGYNLSFDLRHLNRHMRVCGLDRISNKHIWDVYIHRLYELSRQRKKSFTDVQKGVYRRHSQTKLSDTIKVYNIKTSEQNHRALDDAKMCLLAFEHQFKTFTKR